MLLFSNGTAVLNSIELDIIISVKFGVGPRGNKCMDGNKTAALDHII